MQKKLKRFGLPLLLVAALVLLVFGALQIKKNSTVDSTKDRPLTVQPTPQPTKSAEESIATRPYVSLLPSVDAHRLTLKMANLPPDIKGFEYELIYFADFEGNKIERGVDSAGRQVDLIGKSDFAKEFLLGSESCTTGKCKYRYDEGVSEGTLTLKFYNKNGGVDKYMTSFRLQSGTSAKEGLSTGDGSFVFTLTGKPTGYYLTMSMAGLPKQIDFSPKSLPYSIFPSLSYKGTVAFNSTQTEFKIYGYNGSVWQKLDTKIANGQLTAESSDNYLFILGV